MSVIQRENMVLKATCYFAQSPGNFSCRARKTPISPINFAARARSKAIGSTATILYFRLNGASDKVIGFASQGFEGIGAK